MFSACSGYEDVEGTHGTGPVRSYAGMGRDAVGGTDGHSLDAGWSDSEGGSRRFTSKETTDEECTCPACSCDVVDDNALESCAAIEEGQGGERAGTVSCLCRQVDSSYITAFPSYVGLGQEHGRDGRQAECDARRFIQLFEWVSL